MLLFALLGWGYYADLFRAKITELGGRHLLPGAAIFAALMVSDRKRCIREKLMPALCPGTGLHVLDAAEAQDALVGRGKPHYQQSRRALTHSGSGS